MSREPHAALEGLQGLIERQIAPLQALDQRLELRQRLLESQVFWSRAYNGGTLIQA